jgi:hypothetical protein
MHGIVEVVVIVGVVDIAIVVVGPLDRPGFRELKRVSSVSENRLATVFYVRAPHMEAVLRAEFRAEALIVDAPPSFVFCGTLLIAISLRRLATLLIRACGLGSRFGLAIAVGLLPGLILALLLRSG